MVVPKLEIYPNKSGHFIAMILINHRIFRYPIFRQSHIWENSMDRGLIQIKAARQLRFFGEQVSIWPGIFARNERSCGNAYAINSISRIGLHDF